MNDIFPVVAVILALITGTALDAKNRLVPPMDSVVKVETDCGTGSGAFISEHKIITAQHVIDCRKGKITIRTENGHTSEAYVLESDENADLAVLVVKDEFSHPYLGLANTNPERGDKVTLLGNPFIFEFMATFGNIAGTHITFDGAPDNLLMFDGQILPGNSGGPAVNDKGEIVGLAELLFMPQEAGLHAGFLTSVETIRKFLSKGDKHASSGH